MSKYEPLVINSRNKDNIFDHSEGMLKLISTFITNQHGELPTLRNHVLIGQDDLMARLLEMDEYHGFVVSDDNKDYISYLYSAMQTELDGCPDNDWLDIVVLYFVGSDIEVSMLKSETAHDFVINHSEEGYKYLQSIFCIEGGLENIHKLSEQLIDSL